VARAAVGRVTPCAPSSASNPRRAEDCPPYLIGTVRYPRLEPLDAECAKLKKRTLTNLYNGRPAWFDLGTPDKRLRASARHARRARPNDSAAVPEQRERAVPWRVGHLAERDGRPAGLYLTKLGPWECSTCRPVAPPPAWQARNRAEVLRFLDHELSSAVDREEEGCEWENQAKASHQASSMLPDAETLDKILRYGTTLDRENITSDGGAGAVPAAPAGRGNPATRPARASATGSEL